MSRAELVAKYVWQSGGSRLILGHRNNVTVLSRVRGMSSLSSVSFDTLSPKGGSTVLQGEIAASVEE